MNLYLAISLLFPLYTCRNQSGDLSWIGGYIKSDRKRRRSAWITSRFFYLSPCLFILREIDRKVFNILFEMPSTTLREFDLSVDHNST